MHQLHQLGLRVRVLWRPSDLQSPGTVLSVSPDGPVPAGNLVTVTGALRAGNSAANGTDTPRGGRRPPSHSAAHGQGILLGHGVAHRHGKHHGHGRHHGD